MAIQSIYAGGTENNYYLWITYLLYIVINYESIVAFIKQMICGETEFIEACPHYQHFMKSADIINKIIDSKVI